MKPDPGFLEFLRELLEPLGLISTRKMFGGHGIYCDGVFFAIVIEGRLYLKADQQTQLDFLAAGSAPFVYQARDRSIQMSYWSVPEEALDSAEQMQPWASRAIAAAVRKQAATQAAVTVRTVRKGSRTRGA